MTIMPQINTSFKTDSITGSQPFMLIEDHQIIYPTYSNMSWIHFINVTGREYNTKLRKICIAKKGEDNKSKNICPYVFSSSAFSQRGIGSLLSMSVIYNCSYQ